MANERMMLTDIAGEFDDEDDGYADDDCGWATSHTQWIIWHTMASHMSECGRSYLLSKLQIVFMAVIFGAST